MARGRGRFPQARGQRRATSWIGSADQAYTSVAATTAVLLETFPVDGSFVEEGFTIVRVRGVLSVELSASSADQEAVGAFGIGIFNDSAVAAGVGSLLSPWTELDWDGWLVWQAWAFTFESITQAGVLMFSKEFMIDSKAMRKVQPQETVCVIAESEIGAVRVASPFRMLAKYAA